MAKVAHLSRRGQWCPAPVLGSGRTPPPLGAECIAALQVTVRYTPPLACPPSWPPPPVAHMDLPALGFRTTEIFPCTRCAPVDNFGPDARLIAPATVDGPEVGLMVDTGATDSATLSAAYVERVRLRKAPHPGRPPLATVSTSAFGLAHVRALMTPAGGVQHVGVPFNDRFDSGLNSHKHREPFAGVLGAAGMGAGVLAVDPASAQIGFSQRSDLAARLPAPGAQLRLVDAPNTYSPITNDLLGPPLPSGTPGIWLLDTGARWSMIGAEVPLPSHPRPLSPLSRALTRVTRSSLDPETDRGRPLLWNGREIHSLFGGIPLAPFAADFGIPRLDGILGMDFLSQWCVVFDVPRLLVLFYDRDP